MSSTEGTNLGHTISDYEGAERTLFNVLPLTDAIFEALRLWDEKTEARLALIEAAIGITGGGGSTTFTDPSSLTGLAVWLDSDDAASITLASGKVSQWSDKSGNARHFAQATSGYRPTVAANAINSRDAVLFDGVDDFLSCSAAYTARTIFIVGKYADSAPNQYAGFLACRDGTVSSPSDKVSPASDSNIVLGTAGTNTKVAGSGSASACRVNGVDQTVATYNDEVSGGISVGTNPFVLVHVDTGALTGTKDFAIGADVKTAIGTRHLDGYIASVVIYDRVLSSAEIVQVETYLMSRWGVGVGGSGGGSSTPKPVGFPSYAGALTFEDHFDSGLANWSLSGWDPSSKNSGGTFDNYDTVATVAGDSGAGYLRIWPKNGTDAANPLFATTLWTRGVFSQKYGYFEARIKMPRGAVWPAFWLYSDGGGDEIDVVECYGMPAAAYWGSSDYLLTRYGSTLHHAGGGGSNTAGPAKSPLAGADLSDDFHVYGVKWDATGCNFYFDGSPMDVGGENPQQATGNGRLDLTLSVAQFLLLDLAFTERNSSTAVTPRGTGNSMLVDYVRVWA